MVWLTNCSHFCVRDNHPPFNDLDLQPCRETRTSFNQSHGLTPDWTIRDDQPMHLSIMAALSSRDKDVTLFPMLLDGAPPGFNGDVPASPCFPYSDENRTPGELLLKISKIAMCAWVSKEAIHFCMSLVTGMSNAAKSLKFNCSLNQILCLKEIWWSPQSEM